MNATVITELHQHDIRDCDAVYQCKDKNQQRDQQQQENVLCHEASTGSPPSRSKACSLSRQIDSR
jgi:hypothetical protein